MGNMILLSSFFLLCLAAPVVKRQVQNQVINEGGQQRINAPPLLLPIYPAGNLTARNNEAKRQNQFTLFYEPEPMPTFDPVPVDYFLVRLILTEIYVFTRNEIVMPLVFTFDNTEIHSYSIFTDWGITHVHTVVTEMPNGARFTATPIIARRFTALPPEQTREALPQGFSYSEVEFPPAEIFYGEFTITFASINIVIVIGDLPDVGVVVSPTVVTRTSNGQTITTSTSVTVPTTSSRATPPPVIPTLQPSATARTTSSLTGATTRSTTASSTVSSSSTSSTSTSSTSTSSTSTSSSSSSAPVPTPPSGNEIDLSSLSFPFINQAAFVNAMLEQHNYMRARHGASPVSWSTTLSAAALNRSSSGQFAHTPNNPYGENIAMGGFSNPLYYAYFWYAEVDSYDFDNPGYSNAVGHFTEIVWKDVTEIGCAFVDDNPITGYPYYLTCEYRPPGNWIGQFAAQVGEPNNIPYPEQPSGSL